MYQHVFITISFPTANKKRNLTGCDEMSPCRKSEDATVVWRRRRVRGR